MRRWLIKRVLLPLLGVLLAASIPATASAADMYVSPSGSSLGDGSQAAPYGTVGQAAARLPNGGDVWVQPGAYLSEQLWNVRPTATITVHVPRGAYHAGLDFRGSRDFTIDGDHAQGVVRSINLDKSTGPGSGASGRITVRAIDGGSVRFLNRAFDVSVLDSHLHDGGTAIGAPGRTTTDPATGQSPDRSVRILIDGNWIQRYSADAVQISDVGDVEFVNNTIRDVRDPRIETGGCIGAGQPNPNNLPECVHSDGFQIAGGATNILIARNHVLRVGAQGIIVQSNTPAVPRVTQGVTVRGNAVVRDPDSYGPTNATQFNGVLGLTVEQNLLCGVLNGISYTDGFGITPTDGVIRHNVTSSYRKINATTAEDTGNVVVPGGC